MKAAIYCRLSEEDRNKQCATDDSNSIQNQKAMLLQYAAEMGWEIYRIYSDDDYTGSDRRRPEFVRLLADAEQRKFDIVLCKTQSRFTRELELVEKYIHGLFPIWGIRFVSIVDNADTANKGNKKSRQINGLVNEWYLEDMSENIRSVLTNRRENGFHIGAFALYGYKKDPEQKGHLIIDEEAAAVVREVFTLFASGMGKTAIALNMAMSAAKKSDKTVVIFQLEMSRSQLATRLLSAEGFIDSKKLRMGNLTDEDWQKMAEATQTLQKMSIMIDENSGITVPEMKAKCRRLGDQLGLIVIDYLQLMHAPKRTDNRVQEVAEISRSLKIMAKELNVPVLCCCQLSRGPEGRQDKRPMLSDLRESGSIEQDADIVLFIYREDYYNDGSENKNAAELIVAKNRHGETGKIDLQWMGQFTAFLPQDNRHG